MLEISSLKEKRQYNVLEIQFHMHETNNQCLILSFEKVKGKLEIFEAEHTTDIYQAFKECRRISEEEQAKSVQTKPTANIPSPKK